MTNRVIACALAAALAGAPVQAAELLDDGAASPIRRSAVAGAYFRVPLGQSAEFTPSAGLRIAMSGSQRGPRTFSAVREANLLDLRLGRASSASLLIAGRPVSGPEAERMNAGGESKGRLDKIMIGTGIALGAVAAFFLVSSVAD